MRASPQESNLPKTHIRRGYPIIKPRLEPEIALSTLFCSLSNFIYNTPYSLSFFFIFSSARYDNSMESRSKALAIMPRILLTLQPGSNSHRISKTTKHPARPSCIFCFLFITTPLNSLIYRPKYSDYLPITKYRSITFLPDSVSAREWLRWRCAACLWCYSSISSLEPLCALSSSK